MATDRPKPPEGFDEPDLDSGNDEDVPTVNGDSPLDAGEVLHGVVLELVEGESDTGDWYRLRIKDQSRGVVDYFCKGDAKKAARRGLIEMGETVWIAKDTRQDSFERSDGEVVEFYPTQIRFPGGAD